LVEGVVRRIDGGDAAHGFGSFEAGARMSDPTIEIERTFVREGVPIAAVAAKRAAME
jgi:hypothetical protein